MVAIIVTAIVSIIASVGISAIIIIKITAESHKTVEKFVLHEMEETHEFACQIYESLDKLIKKLNKKI